MKEAVAHDFEKYAGSIKQIYQQRVTKKLLLITGGLGLLLVAFSFITSQLKWLLIGLVLAVWLIEVGRGLLSLNRFADFLATSQTTWLKQIETVDWSSPEWLVYEDENHYIIKDQEQVQRIAKKGSRTLPSDNRGLSLIVGENAQLFTQGPPVLIVYCDTTDIKAFDLAKKNAAIIKQMQITKFKNKIIRPLFYVLIALIVIWYLTGGF